MKYELREIARRLGAKSTEEMLPESAVSFWENRYAERYGSIPRGMISDNREELEDFWNEVIEFKFDGYGFGRKRWEYVIYKRNEYIIDICIKGLTKFFSDIPKFLYFKPMRKCDEF